MLLDKNLPLRIYRYCIHYLNSSNIPCLTPVKETPAEYVQVIHHALMSFPKFIDSNGQPIERSNFINTMLVVARQFVVIPESSFNWIEKDERACMWLWLTIKTGVAIIKIDSASITYDTLKLNPFPINHQERLVTIIDFFDRLSEDYAAKTNRLNDWKTHWVRIYNDASYLKNLDAKDEDKVNWLWLYLKEKITPDRTKFDNITYPILPVECLSPLSLREKFLSIYGVLDLWVSTPEARELLLIKMMKTLSQRKYRQKMTGKVVITTTLYIDTRDKLNELANSQGKRISEVLDYLINQEHKKLKYK